ncbi:MAG: hypothetical protein AB1452_06315 [Pseudomonadota bacterium]
MRKQMTESSLRGLVRIDTPLSQAMQEGVLAIISSHIRSGTVVLLKHAIPEPQVLALRDEIVAWRKQCEVVSFSVDTNVPGLNFHRIDAGSRKSAIPHVFHQHGFGDLSLLSEQLATRLLAIAGPMLTLQNAVARTGYTFGTPEIRIKALQYPSGGGFLENHKHPIEPQRVGLILALSKAGQDFRRGGTTFFAPSGLVDTGPYHDAGDLILFRYDLEHAVTPVDADASLDWNSHKGRWTLVLELISTSKRSKVA